MHDCIIEVANLSSYIQLSGEFSYDVGIYSTRNVTDNAVC